MNKRLTKVRPLQKWQHFTVLKTLLTRACAVDQKLTMAYFCWRFKNMKRSETYDNQMVCTTSFSAVIWVPGGLLQIFAVSVTSSWNMWGTADKFPSPQRGFWLCNLLYKQQDHDCSRTNWKTNIKKEEVWAAMRADLVQFTFTSLKFPKRGRKIRHWCRAHRFRFWWLWMTLFHYYPSILM